jgi:hypothetical protein
MEKTTQKNNKISVAKSIIFCIFALGIVAGNFLFENNYGVAVEQELKKFSEFNYAEDNIITKRGVLRFDASAEENSMKTVFAENNEYVFDMEAGRLWGNFSISNADINIVANNVVVMPNKAVFDLIYNGTQFEMAVYGGDVYLGFVEEGIEITKTMDAYEDVFINKILVPQSTQVRFAMRQINSEIEPLLYSKLTKELRLSSIPETKRKDSWTTDNEGKDFEFIENTRQKYFSEVIRKGSSIHESFFGEMAVLGREKLTFFKEKKEESVYRHLFNYLDDAIFYAATNNRTKSRERLTKFYSYRDSLPANLRNGEYIDNKINQYLDDLLMFDSRSSLYDVIEKLLETKFSEGKDRHGIVNIYWLNVYNSMKISEEEATIAFDKYYRYFDRVIGLPGDQDFYVTYLSYKNQLLDSLLLRTSIFYNDTYFEIKNVFEQILLENYEEGRLKEELKQLFISNKIDLMKRLRTFFFDGEIAVQETKDIFGRLIAETKKLMPPEDSGVAVIRLFQSQLEDIIDFWGYLESTEYHSGAFGKTHKERYEFYLEERDLIKGVEDLLKDVLGEEVEPQTIEEAITRIESQLKANVEIYDIEVIGINAPDQRNVEVRGIVGGYPFNATYDRYQDSLKEIYVYGELISARAMKVGGLLLLLESRFADVREEIEQDEEITMDTIAQRIARKNIADTLASAGFVVDMNNISVADRTHVLYRVQEITLEEYSGIEITFDLKITEGENVKNLFMKVHGKPKVFEGEYSIEELKDMVKIEEDMYRNPRPVIEETEETEDRISR